ncbi:MAG: DUF6788 family protein [Acidobacteriota bacterium]
MNRTQLLRKLVKQAERMIQTGFSQTLRTCGTPSCGCHSDPTKKHGPHTYVSFRTEEGKSSGMYVPVEHVDEVQRARQTWKEFGETAKELAALNRKQMQQSWRAAGKAKVRR